MVSYLNLDDFREQITEIDTEILYLLKRRAQTSRKILKWKFENGKDIFDSKREKDVLSNISKLGGSMGLDGTFLYDLFNLVIEDSKKIQEKELDILKNKN